jgi:hypothetical protein
MFSEWWKYSSDVSNKKDVEKDRKYATKVGDLALLIKGLQKHVDSLEKAVEASLKGANLKDNTKSGASSVFYRGRDPTVLVGGIDSGWPEDFGDRVDVRLPSMIVKPAGALPNGLEAMISLVQKKLPDKPDDISAVAVELLKEFHALRPGGDFPGKAPAGKMYPQFHDTKNKRGTWRDQWGDRQPCEQPPLPPKLRYDLLTIRCRVSFVC